MEATPNEGSAHEKNAKVQFRQRSKFAPKVLASSVEDIGLVHSITEGPKGS